jgi:ABC-type tungstate transport system permease subunit
MNSLLIYLKVREGLKVYSSVAKHLLTMYSALGFNPQHCKHFSKQLFFRILTLQEGEFPITHLTRGRPWALSAVH